MENTNTRKLYRSSKNKVIAGVCGGIAEYFDINPAAVRLATVILVVVAGLSLWVYIILWLVLRQK